MSWAFPSYKGNALLLCLPLCVFKAPGPHLLTFSPSHPSVLRRRHPKHRFKGAGVGGNVHTDLGGHVGNTAMWAIEVGQAPLHPIAIEVIAGGSARAFVQKTVQSGPAGGHKPVQVAGTKTIVIEA